MEDHQSAQIRQKIFQWLDHITLLNENMLDWSLLTKGFQIEGKAVPLIGAKGIWKPAVIKEFPISITSVVSSVYSDEILTNDLIQYSYRGKDPMHPDNVGLRNCMKYNIPLIYLHQIVKGRYFAAGPVFIVGDNPDKLLFTVSVDNDSVFSKAQMQDSVQQDVARRYQTREVVVRLHQKSFRERVLKAYKDHCAICNLKHRNLLDAAHIIPDADPESKPVVANGISLCKIHHAAYDQNIIGISPDYEVNVREDILEEVDGPMLKHGIQGVNKTKIWIPKNSDSKPNKEWLDIRYQRFLRA